MAEFPKWLNDLSQKWFGQYIDPSLYREIQLDIMYYLNKVASVEELYKICRSDKAKTTHVNWAGDTYKRYAPKKLAQAIHNKIFGKEKVCLQYKKDKQ